MRQKVVYLFAGLVFIRAIFRYEWGLDTLEILTAGMMFGAVLCDVVQRWRN
jgi:hypothetical protein